MSDGGLDVIKQRGRTLTGFPFLKYQMHQRLPKIPKDTSLLITAALYDGKEEQGQRCSDGSSNL